MTFRGSITWRAQKAQCGILSGMRPHTMIFDALQTHRMHMCTSERGKRILRQERCAKEGNTCLSKSCPRNWGLSCVSSPAMCVGRCYMFTSASSSHDAQARGNREFASAHESLSHASSRRASVLRGLSRKVLRWPRSLRSRGGRPGRRNANAAVTCSQVSLG